MAILGDYEDKQAEWILPTILARPRVVCNSQTDLKKFIQQLIILARMRNLELLTIKISEEMPIHIDIEKDYLYNLGYEKGSALLAEMTKLIEDLNKAKQKALAKAEKEKLKAKAEAKTQEGKVKAEKKAAISRMLDAKISSKKSPEKK